MVEKFVYDGIEGSFIDELNKTRVLWGDKSAEWGIETDNVSTFTDNDIFFMQWFCHKQNHVGFKLMNGWFEPDWCGDITFEHPYLNLANLARFAMRVKGSHTFRFVNGRAYLDGGDVSHIIQEKRFDTNYDYDGFYINATSETGAVIRKDKHADRVFKTFLEWNKAVDAEEAYSMRTESRLIYEG